MHQKNIQYQIEYKITLNAGILQEKCQLEQSTVKASKSIHRRVGHRLPQLLLPGRTRRTGHRR